MALQFSQVVAEGIKITSSRLFLGMVTFPAKLSRSRIGVSPNVGWYIRVGCSVSRWATN